MRVLRWIYRDWVRAPVSGTTILLCWAGALVAAYHGDSIKMLLWGIFAQVVANGRGPLGKDVS
jgi:uncharacterized membrane protein